MSERRSGRRTAALALATAGTAGMLAAAVSVPAQAAPAAKCAFASTDLSFADSPARVIAQGECVGEGSLFVKITRNGTVVFSGGNGVGIVTAIYTCHGSALGDFKAVWSTGQIDQATFACG